MTQSVTQPVDTEIWPEHILQTNTIEQALAQIYDTGVTSLWVFELSCQPLYLICRTKNKSRRLDDLKRSAHNPNSSRQNGSHFPAIKRRRSSKMPLREEVNSRGNADRVAATFAVDAQNADLLARGLQPLTVRDRHFSGVDSYHRFRERFVQQEKSLDFDARCRADASAKEEKVDRIITKLRENDEKYVYGAAPPREGYAGQLHKRFPGDHFLSNVDLIDRTSLFKVAEAVPKGGHLHIHFNACLPPDFLLGIAKEMERMFITSNLPLISDNNFANLDKCEIQFTILNKTKEQENPGDLFSRNYRPHQTMNFQKFLKEMPGHFKELTPDEWLLKKLVFHENEAHGPLQTAAGAWEKFNVRTRMMKGLFNYETAYKRYTRGFLKSLVKDNIQYAEIRPNFMASNQLFTDDGENQIDNRGIMNIIIKEVETFKNEMAAEGKFFGGLKVIYCTPRSLEPGLVERALDECIALKKEWPEWMSGFDLAGEEAKGTPLKAFIPQFLSFKEKCKTAGLDIPFLFHCGETLDMGTDTDGNLVDALLLGAKRIGHGFALPKHPHVMQHMKAENVCIEWCSISNEELGLTPRASGHPMYSLLANNVHCTINSDNGTLFKSTLPHDFYQAMIGRADFGLFGWKQLTMWSIEHACLNDVEKEKILKHWEKSWDDFLDFVMANYGHVIQDSG